MNFDKNFDRKQNRLYLTAYYSDSYETLLSGCQKLLSYARNHHKETEKQIYTETVVGDWAVNKI